MNCLVKISQSVNIQPSTCQLISGRSNDFDMIERINHLTSLSSEIHGNDSVADFTGINYLTNQ